MTRLVVVSNRIAPVEEGKASAGGLSIAVEEALAVVGGLWFGWNGKTGNDSSVQIEKREGKRYELATIALSRADYQDYYAGYSNATLWPLFHYRLNLLRYSKAHAVGYQRVNQRFAGALAPLVEAGDLIWVHDYHLIPLGRELKRTGLTNRMGFFLHTPFPPPDVLMACSDHESLVRALFEYDVIGLQTDTDVRNLQEYVRRRGDGRVRGRTVEAFGHGAYVRAFPIGVYPDALAEDAVRAANTSRTRLLRRSLDGRQLIIGVDRLDYSKGLDSRFASYETLLANYPENRGHVTFMQIAPPTRGDVASYAEIRTELERLSGHINGRFAEFDWVPLRYLNKSFRREVLMGFYRVARAGFVTPLRDGMNLVAKEYVAAQDPTDPGVLVLSQFAGAAAELDGAVLVNPYDQEGMTEGLQSALTMPLGERIERYAGMMTTLRRNNLGRWQRQFMDVLAERD